MENVSSEEELLGLRNEGKISEAEYQDLLSAMRKPSSTPVEVPAPQSDKAASKRRLGKIAFVLMLVGVILPTFCLFTVELLAGNIVDADIVPWFAIGLNFFGIAAFVLGAISWADVFGKATVIITPVVVVFGQLIAC